MLASDAIDLSPLLRGIGRALVIGSLAFVVVTLLLALVFLGAAYLARRRSRTTAVQELSEYR